MEIPKTCKAAVLEEYGKPIQCRDVPIPQVGRGAILVQVEMAGICGSDVHIQQGDLGVGDHISPPMIQGHEIIGKIVKLGEGRETDVTGERINVGNRIMWDQTSCGQCYYCEVVNQPLLCSSREHYGFFPPEDLRGGFAEYEYIVPATKVIKVPNELSNDEAIGVACAFRSVVAGFEKLGDIGFQNNIVIQGAGPIGLYATVVARESNVGKVVVIGAPKDRLELAKQWGADHVINIDEFKNPSDRKSQILELTNGRGPEIVIECSGYAPAFNEGVDMIRKGGKYLILGLTSQMEINMAPSKILDKNMVIVGSKSATIRHYDKALQFIKKNRHKYPFAKLVSSKYRLHDINEALENMKLGKEIKPVIDNLMV